MILTTPQELRLYLPTHVIESLEPFYGFIDNSEHDFLLERIGKPLYAALTEKYNKEADKEAILPGGYEELTPWNQLIQLCQRPVAFDMLYRAADVSAVSVNESGLNVMDTDGYDNADDKTIDRYKKRLNTEAHRGIDRLLVTLEEWAEDISVNKGGEDVSDALSEKDEIIALWKQSRYYYLAEGLFINTARKFNEFVDIYDSREKFIQLLPDLRYCQEFVIRPELGDALTDDLVSKSQAGNGSEAEKKAIRLAQYALALKVEDRSTLFKRAEAKDEAIGAVRRLTDYLKANQDKLNAEAVKSAPFYEERKPEKVEQVVPSNPWQNNRKGNKVFVTRAIE